MARLHDTAVHVRLRVSEQAIPGIRVQRRRRGCGEAVRQDDRQIPKPHEAQEQEEHEEQVPRFPYYQVQVPAVP